MTDFVFSRRFDKALPIATKAKGVWIEDSGGKRYMEAGGSALVVNVGYGREEIIEAVTRQMNEFYYVHGTLFTSASLEGLAERLADHAPKELSRFYFMSTGSEAVETAIKLARQIHVESGRPQRDRLISRWKSYHGLTIGALAASGRTYFRQPFTPLLPEVVHIPPPYCLRCSYGLTAPICGLRCAAALEETILDLGPDTVSAFVAEPVSGATLGVYPPPPGYLKLIREICDRYGVTLIFDEVMTGMGRTGRWFAGQHDDVVPDLMTLGKGLSSGSLPLSAVACRPEHLELIRRGSGNFVHGGTFSHHAVAAAAALAVTGILEHDNLIRRSQEMGQYLGKRLKAVLSGSPYVLDIRGIGMMWGVEIVQNKDEMTPFARRERVAERLREAMFGSGVLVYLSTGFAGGDGDAIIFGPPFIIEQSEIDLAVDTFAATLEDTVGRKK